MCDSLHLKKRLNCSDQAGNSCSRQKNGSESIISYLQDFGLTEKEAKVYFTLSKIGSATQAEIAHTTQFSRLQTYRALKGLLNNGLVEMSLERPRKFTPLKIEQAINLLAQEAERRVFDFEKKKPLLLKEWAAVNDFQKNNINYAFRIIQGPKNVSKFRTMLCESAKKEIATTIKPNDLMKLVTEGTDDLFEKLTYKNIFVRGLSEVNRTNVEATKRFLEFSKLHHTQYSNIVPFTIIDEQEVLICLSRDGKEGVPENAIWTNHPEMVQILKQIFEVLWASSEDGNSRIKELKRNQFSN